MAAWSEPRVANLTHCARMAESDEGPRVRKLDERSAECLRYSSWASSQSFASVVVSLLGAVLTCSPRPSGSVRVLFDAQRLLCRVETEGFGADPDLLVEHEGFRLLTKFATVSVVTRPRGSLETRELLWRGGDLAGCGVSSCVSVSYCSRVVVKDLLANLPVRRRILLGTRHEKHLASLRALAFPLMASNQGASFDFVSSLDGERKFGSAGPDGSLPSVLVDAFGLDPRALVEISAGREGNRATLLYLRDWRSSKQVLFEHVFRAKGGEDAGRGGESWVEEVRLAAWCALRQEAAGPENKGGGRKRPHFSFVLRLEGCGKGAAEALIEVLRAFSRAESGPSTLGLGGARGREAAALKWGGGSNAGAGLLPFGCADGCCVPGAPPPPQPEATIPKDDDFRQVGGVPSARIASAASLGRLGQSLLPGAITRDHLRTCTCLGQVDLKFVAAVCGPYLVLFDQHAADERVRLEALTLEAEEALGAGKCGARCVPPLGFRPNPEEVSALAEYPDRVSGWGWEVAVRPQGNLVLVSRAPMVAGRRLGAEDLRQYLRQLKQTGGASAAPEAVTRVLGSRACRSAVKFGDALTGEECRELAGAVAAAKMPFQCAHGRPTCAPLVDLGVLRRAGEAMKRSRRKGGRRTWDMDRIRRLAAGKRSRRS